MSEKNQNKFVFLYPTNLYIRYDIYIEKLKKIYPDAKIIPFDTENKLLEKVKGIYFTNTYIIVPSEILQKFIQKFSKEMKDITIIPKFIIYFSQKQEILPIKENILYYDYFTYGRVEPYNLIEFIKSEKNIKNDEEVSFNANIKLKGKKLEKDKFYFEIIDNEEKLILPVYFRTKIKMDSSIKTEEFTKFLYNEYKYNNKIEGLLSQIINLKNIPPELLSKYWARVYTANDFHYDMNDYLKKGKKKNYEKYKIFIQMMYEGLNLKSLKEPKENIDLYRGCKLSNKELNRLREHLKNNNKDNAFPNAIVYSRTFLSFSKSKEIAESFLLNDKYFNKNIMKKVLIVLKADESNNKYLNSYADIEQLSFYQNEREVLVYPFSCFEVTKINSYSKYVEIELNYLSKYDTKLRKFFENPNINKNKNLIDSEFKKNLIMSNIIKEDNLKKSSISSIFKDSEKYINNQKNMENQIRNEYLNLNKIHNQCSLVDSTNQFNEESKSNTFYESNRRNNVTKYDKSANNLFNLNINRGYRRSNSELDCIRNCKRDCTCECNCIDCIRKCKRDCTCDCDCIDCIRKCKRDCTCDCDCILNCRWLRDNEEMKKWIKWILIILLIAIGLTLVIVLPIVLCNRGKKDDYNQEFQIFLNTKNDTLYQYSYESFNNYETITNEKTSPYIIYTKAIYDIYTYKVLNSSYFPEKYNNSTIFATTIAINSFCNKLVLNMDENKCELNSILDMNIRKEDRLRRNTEDNYYIKNAILPICIFNHTNDNIIISVSCLNTLSQNIKNEITKAFMLIKPSSVNKLINDSINMNNTNNQNTFNISKKDNQLYIYIYNNKCTDIINNDIQSIECNSTTNIIIDKDGSLFSTNKNSYKNMIKDEQNKFLENSVYKVKKIFENNSTKYNPKNYKSNLNVFLSISSFLMTNYNFSLKSYKEQIKVYDEDNYQFGQQETASVYIKDGEKILFDNFFTFPIELNLFNDFGMGKKQDMKTYYLYNINNNYQTKYLLKNFNVNLDNIFKPFISLTKSGNKLANSLNQELKEALLNFRGIIFENIKQINSMILNTKGDLTKIFDPILAIKLIDSLPYDFIFTLENLIYSLDDLENNIPKILNTSTINLSQDISDFLDGSHNILSEIINYIIEIQNILNSEENKILEISSYYLNEKNNYYYNIFENYKYILFHYYEKEKEIILPLVDDVLDKFYKNAAFFISRFNYKLDNISERLTNGNLKIFSSFPEDYNKTVINIKKISFKIDNILNEIKNKTFGNILEDNGYFENQAKLDDTISYYEEIFLNAFNISYNLDHNKIIDYTFDNLFKYLKSNFLFLLRYMDNSITEKFPFEENTLDNSYFNNKYLEQINQNFLLEKNNIINHINQENENYMKSINDIFNCFIRDNITPFKQSLFKLVNNFDKLYFQNLNNAFSDFLSFVIKKIKETIENNEILYNEYFNNINNVNTYHITKGFIDKYNIYIDNINKFINYIENELKLDLKNKYMNIINETDSYFQKMNLNNNILFQKYKKQLISFEEYNNQSFKSLLERINDYISEEIFNTNFLPLINDLINNSLNILTNDKINYQNIYNKIEKKQKSDISQDYDISVEHGGDRYCCDYLWKWCIEHCRHPKYYTYEGRDVQGTNNHLDIKFIHFSNYSIILDEKLNELYSNLSNDILLYNSYLPHLENNLESLKIEILKKDESLYMNNIKNYIINIIKEKLENNLLKTTYKYYNNKINNILPETLDKILKQWENIYKDIYKNITDNKDNFKYSINEFYITAYTYFELYNNNISFNYINSIIEKLKNDFNYTIKYYYDFINVKINDICSEILKDLPINEEPFNEIIQVRTNEIIKLFDDLMNLINNSKNNFITKNVQESVINISSPYFFFNHSIVNDHLNTFKNQLNETMNKIKLIIDEIKMNKSNPNEIIVAKFYLENNINKIQMNDIYDDINKSDFINLENDIYFKIINKFWKNNNYILVRKINDTINELNTINKNNFNKELERYKSILNEKFNKEFYSKTSMSEKINLIFSNGLNNIEADSKQPIYDILDSILNKIKNHIINEGIKLSSRRSLYHNNYTYIQNRLNNYKDSIYKKVYSALTFQVDEFNAEITQKFYKNHIETELNKFQSYFKNDNFEIAEFLNISLNLNKILYNEIELLIDEYKKLAINKIEVFYSEKIHSLDTIFSFTSIQSKINNELNSFYDSQLFNILNENILINKSQDIINYDFSDSIIGDIELAIEEGVGKIKQLMKKIEGNNYIIKTPFNNIFKNVKEDVIEKIKSQFLNFIIEQKNYENKEFDRNIAIIISEHFNSILKNIIPLFSMNLFERNKKSNELEKINKLYNNLKYYLDQTTIYYLNLVQSNSLLNLPQNIENEILTLNDIESLLSTKSNLILYKLNITLEANIEYGKSYLAEKYINNIIPDYSFKNKFNDKLYELIKLKLNQRRYIIETQYYEQMKTNIVDNFIIEYINILNKKNEIMNYIIQNYKQKLLIKLGNLFTIDFNPILTKIRDKFNQTDQKINEYYSYFNTFKISEEIINFFESEIIDQEIIPKYNDINYLINEQTAYYIEVNFDFNYKRYKDIYSKEKFEDFFDDKKSKLFSNIEKFNLSLNNYGTSDEKYKNNLNKEIDNYNSGIIYGRKELYSVHYDIAFNDLKKSSSILKEYILTLNLFSEFQQKFKQLNNSDYIIEKNNEYKYSQYILNLNAYDIYYYFLMLNGLNELYDISLEYFGYVYDIYSQMKEKIINKIIEIDELITISENITNKIMNFSYLNLKNGFYPINYKSSVRNYNTNFPKYIQNNSDNIFEIETNIDRYNIMDYKLIIDFNEEENTSIFEIIGNIYINLKPYSLKIDLYSSNGQLGKIGKKINIDFNNIYSTTKFIFDCKLNNVTLISNLNIEEYSIKTQYYEERIYYYDRFYSGMKFPFKSYSYTINSETPIDEKYYEIDSKNEKYTKKYYY